MVDGMNAPADAGIPDVFRFGFRGPRDVAELCHAARTKTKNMV